MSRHAIIQITRKLGPMTAKQLAIELKLTGSTIRTAIRRARAHGTQYLRIAGWAQDVPKYGPGPEPDVEGGSTGERILYWLDHGERATVAQLASRLGVTKNAVDSAVRRLRQKPGRLRIARLGAELMRMQGRELKLQFALAEQPAQQELLSDHDDRHKMLADARATLTSVTENLRHGDTLGASLALQPVEKVLDALLVAQKPAKPAQTEPWKQAIGSSNCMQCCVGYMLGLPTEQVPNFAEHGGWKAFEAFAKSQGYASVMLPGNYQFEADYLVSGTTERGTSHMVIMNDGELVFDPHPSNAGLISVEAVWLLSKLAQQPAQQGPQEKAIEIAQAFIRGHDAGWESATAHHKALVKQQEKAHQRAVLMAREALADMASMRSAIAACQPTPTVVHLPADETEGGVV